MGDAVTTLHIVPAAADATASGGRSVSRSHLVNRLNYINFQGQTILVSLRHLIYDDALYLRARPQPCSGERLDLVWAEAQSLKQLLKNYRFDHLLISDGKKYLVVNTELVTLAEEGLTLVLPASCREFQARKIRRHPAREISVQLIQHGVQVDCNLVDFTPVSLRISGSAVSAGTLQLVNNEVPVLLRLYRYKKVLLSGSFAILSREVTGNDCTFILQHLDDNIRRFRGKRYRNMRRQLVPSPNVVFEHPLVDKKVNLKISDISGTGFSVEESEGDSLLMPGMMLHGAKITLAPGLSVSCLAQVVFRNVVGHQAGETTARCGVAILDMGIDDHGRLLSILHQVENRRSYVSTEVDMDELWDFFFETGFIYPGKYLHFQAHKESIKETYQRLYTRNPQIARHFIYQERGAILGHLAMVRFYRDSWLIHHHAARKSAATKAGLAVLNQVSNYLNELESFAFAHLRYVYCYYRPDNKFPSRVFGAFAKELDDQGSCSLDLFGYSRYTGGKVAVSLPPSWELSPSTPFDIAEVGRFYRHVSGGVMTRAFDLDAGGSDAGALERQYRDLGFRKETYFYSLRKSGSLKAFLLVNCTDAGFNMAELTNCVTLIAVDEEVPPQMLEACLGHAARHYDQGNMPVLTFSVLLPGKMVAAVREGLSPVGAGHAFQRRVLPVLRTSLPQRRQGRLSQESGWKSPDCATCRFTTAGSSIPSSCSSSTSTATSTSRNSWSTRA